MRQLSMCIVFSCAVVGCDDATTTSSSSTGGSGSSTSSTASMGPTGSTTSSSSGTGGGEAGPIGEWTDAPGACPMGVPEVVITSSAELAEASRAEGARQGDAASTCYLLKNGVYEGQNVVMFITQGGESVDKRRWFIGETRAGVILHTRAAFDTGVGDVTIANMTFDLTGFSQGGSFNTLDALDSHDVTIDRVTFTGDCATGLMGGHIETSGATNLLVEACLIEKFGHCGGGGHEDHGVYLSGGAHLVFRNNVIRGNASRGIQMYTQGGEFGTLDDVLVERNRIYENGHGDYEDGIVINGADTGTISNVVVRRNLLYKNHYSGVRFAGDAVSHVTLEHNTFDSNGAGSTHPSRSEVNIDEAGGEPADSTVTANLFSVGNQLLDDCFGAKAKGLSIAGDFVNGALTNGASDCIGAETMGDPQFKDAAASDYHPMNPAAVAFGAYAP
ncbi:MAG: right-handed parallel beta-helix repeat-containing protein [Polyangiaceae bacterium]